MQALAYSKVTFDVKSLSADTILLEVMVEGNSAALFDVVDLGECFQKGSKWS